MKKLTRTLIFVCSLCIIFGFGLYKIQNTVFAEQSGSSPESGATSRIKAIFDSLVTLSHGSESAGGWGNWGAYWNRIRSAAEWVPSGTATNSDVKNGVTYYGNSRTQLTGTLSLTGNAATTDVASGKTFYSNSFVQQTGTANLAQDFSLQSLAIHDDYAGGDETTEESSWSNTATNVWKDDRTGLYWSDSLTYYDNYYSNSFTIVSCDFFSTQPRGNYGGADNDCGISINTCAQLNLASGGTSNTDWYLPTAKELIQAAIDGLENQTTYTYDNVYVNDYWSSTEYSISTSLAYRVRRSMASSSNWVTNYQKGLGADVRCVRRD